MNNNTGSYNARLTDLLKSFKNFDDTLTEFITEHGYNGDISDKKAKAAFVSRQASSHNIILNDNPLEWFSGKRPDREGAFEIIFSFGLDVPGTADFFKRIYCDRGFEYRCVNDMMYYYCISRGYGYGRARSLIEDAAGIQSMTDIPAELMGSQAIRDQLDEFRNDDELINFIKRNFFRLDLHNMTAKKMIRSFWYEICDFAERENPSLKSDEEIPVGTLLRFISGLTDESEKYELTDEEISTIRKYASFIRRHFHLQQTIETVLGGNAEVPYEDVRNALIYLAFYKYHVQIKLDGSRFANTSGRSNAQIDQALCDGGFEKLYAGSIYDWLFLYADASEDSLMTFRSIVAAIMK